MEAERKRVSSAASNAKRAAVGNGVDRKLSREKELRAAEERETLKARIGQSHWSIFLGLSLTCSRTGSSHCRTDYPVGRHLATQ